MSNFFDSSASNIIVATAAKVSKMEKEITKAKDSESLVLFYAAIQDGLSVIESSMLEYRTRIKETKNEV